MIYSNVTHFELTGNKGYAIENSVKRDINKKEFYDIMANLRIMGLSVNYKSTLTKADNGELHDVWELVS
jgi:hypothetical protein